VYELIILSILMQSPVHGYVVAKTISDLFGPHVKMSNGRLYPLLARLQEEKLIELCPESNGEHCVPKGSRQQRKYQITAAGRQRFHCLMMDTSSNPGEYQYIFLHKVTALPLLSSAEQLYLIDHYLNYCQTRVLHLMHEAGDREQKRQGISLERQGAALNLIRHIQDQLRLEVDWVQQLREQVVISSSQAKEACNLTH
jgi:DNA-binding PadR family transcriptional regulator